MSLDSISGFLAATPGEVGSMLLFPESDIEMSSGEAGGAYLIAALSAGGDADSDIVSCS